MHFLVDDRALQAKRHNVDRQVMQHAPCHARRGGQLARAEFRATLCAFGFRGAPMRACLFPLACLLAAGVADAPAAPWQMLQVGGLLTHADQPARGASTVVIADGRILAVHAGHGAIEDAPADAEVIDLKDLFLLPGLIDAHVHMDSDAAGMEGQLEGVTRSTAAAAYDAAVNARRTLAAGFTTVRNLGDGDGVTLALRDAIAAGQVRGPRMLDAGRSISTTSGHMDARLGFRDDLHEAIGGSNLCDGVESCRRAVRRQVGRGVDWIKIATTGGVNSRIGAGLGQQMFPDEALAIVETAHLYGKKVAVHAHGADGIAVALAAGADSIEHGTLLDDANLAALKKSGAWVVPTLSTVNGYIERLKNNPDAYSPAVRAKIEWRIAVTGKAFRRAVEAKARIAFGTDAGVSLHGCNADEFALMVQHGMTPAQALTAATQGGADLLDLEAEIGTIEPGKRADLIALPADPVEDLAALKDVRWVMTGGMAFDPAPDRRRQGCAP
jgi:imidazolonepropionase-like amidohydrolase